MSVSTIIGIITVVTASVAIVVTLLVALSHPRGPGHPHSSSANAYPTGIANAADPSGQSPPGADALKGYTLSYETSFPGSTLPSGWNVFTGVPQSDPKGRFAKSHVVVSDGVLRLNTFKDPQYDDRWITGGLCQCEVAKVYGAYFVRSRITGGGANEVELLWPKSNVWPPEIDFNESSGQTDSTSSTVHFNVINTIDQRSVQINLKRWHTWGVIWTPTSITYVVDGQAWGTIKAKNEIPVVPMTLDFEQREACSSGRLCPTHPVSMLIDWVAEYQPKR